MSENDLQDRLFRFVIDVIKMLRALKGGAERIQLLVNVIRRELYKHNSEIGRLIEESIELKNIVGSISVKVSPKK